MTEPVCLIPDWRGKHLIIKTRQPETRQPAKNYEEYIYIYLYMMYTKNTLELGLYETRNET